MVKPWVARERKASRLGCSLASEWESLAFCVENHFDLQGGPSSKGGKAGGRNVLSFYRKAVF